MSKSPSKMTTFQAVILRALQSKPMYEGTVTDRVKKARRRKNKAARIARRAHRKGN